MLVQVMWYTAGAPAPAQLMTSAEANHTKDPRLLGDGVFFGSSAFMALFCLFMGIIHRDEHSARLSISLL